MKIEIKLENPDYCNGCPMLNVHEADEHWFYGYVSCQKSYFVNSRNIKDIIHYKCPRPEQCKKENDL